MSTDQETIRYRRQRSLAQLERCMGAGDAEFGVLCADRRPQLQPADQQQHRLRGLRAPVRASAATSASATRRYARRPGARGSRARSAASRRSCARSRGGSRSASASQRRSVPTTRSSTRSALPTSRRGRKLMPLAELGKDFGTVGSGDRYVNLMEDPRVTCRYGVHFGSRGFGPRDRVRLPRPGRRDWPSTARRREGEMDLRRLSCSRSARSSASRTSRRCRWRAITWVRGSRHRGCRGARDPGYPSTHEVRDRRNFASREEHFGRTYSVIRKGSTPPQGRPRRASSAARWVTSR